MSESFLSQEEVDALLEGVTGESQKLSEELQEQGEGARRRFSIYGEDHGFKDEAGTDLAALAAGRIAVTPLHFDLTYEPGIEALSARDLSQLLEADAPQQP